MFEASKSMARRLSDSRFASRFFVGDGIDVGCGDDSIAQYGEFFPMMRDVRGWDVEDGDAQYLEAVPDASVDFVHSSHCLEHLRDPLEALRNWLRVVRPGGHVIFTVPDEDLYEQGIFPSTYNDDHKFTFTIFKEESWSRGSVNMLALLANIGPEAQVLKVELLDATYRYALPRVDQTMTPVGESAIEIVVRRRTADEVAEGGRLPQRIPAGV